MVKVFLVDDHEVVRRGLIDLLSLNPWMGDFVLPSGGCAGLRSVTARCGHG